MIIQRGEIWWASLPEPAGSELGYRRPVLIIQADPFAGVILPDDLRLMQQAIEADCETVPVTRILPTSPT